MVLIPHSARIDDMPLWSGKGVIREYLEKLNESGQVCSSVTHHFGCRADMIFLLGS